MIKNGNILVGTYIKIMNKRIDNVDYPLDTKILNERHIENEEYEITLDIEF